MAFFLRVIATLSACLLGTASVQAQSLDQTPQIQVTGQSEVFVKPEAMTIVLGVTSIADTHIAAMRENARIMKSVLEAAKVRGIAATDLKTARINLVDITSRGKSSRAARQFRAENTAYVTVRNLDQVATVIGDLITAGANRVHSLTPVLPQDAERQKKLRAAAVADARVMADDLAKAAGIRLGRILRMSSNSIGIPARQGFAAARSVAADVGDVPVEPGLVRVTQSVNIVWQLEP